MDGICGGFGDWRTNRSGVLRNAPGKRGLAGGVDCLGLSEVDLIGRHQADADVVMVFVVPGEDVAAECAGLVDGLKAFGEFRLIFQRLEVGLRKGVVV